MVDINGIMSDIASSAHEQATGLRQVNTAVNEMDQVTQRNAAMVEETTAASHALGAETEELTRLIGQYKIRQSGEETLRAQLKKAAPHAFREAPKRAPAPERAPAPRSKSEPARRAAPRAVVNGAPSSGEADWQDF